PGIVLAILDQEHMTVTDVLLAEDGHAQERSLLEDVYPLVRARDIWVADRNFCTLGFLLAICKRGGSFALRQHSKLPGKLVGKRQAKGRCDTGHVYEQRWRLRDEDAKPVDLRRVTVELDKP